MDCEKIEWGGILRCMTSDGLTINIAEELNQLEEGRRRMTTPQSILHDIHHKVGLISRLIEGYEDSAGIFERIEHIESQNDDIINSLQILENQLNVIILQVLEQKNE